MGPLCPCPNSKKPMKKKGVPCKKASLPTHPLKGPLATWIHLLFAGLTTRGGLTTHGASGQ
ncbi:unnamed protein product [Staurois parvus]|uniref:Uncharacterized protein n=1 Tax=Staurois parvus TaxID=386267 RepID=A0ABN9H5S2_9NEOB|nr:unnamed protein product [Staurois parvus]